MRERQRAHTHTHTHIHAHSLSLSLSLIVALIYDVYYTICLSFVCLYVTCVITKIV